MRKVLTVLCRNASSRVAWWALRCKQDPVTNHERHNTTFRTSHSRLALSTRVTLVSDPDKGA